MALNGGASCDQPLRVWASIEMAFCVLGVLNALWKHKRVPQLVVDRNAQTDDTFIAASRLTIGDMIAVYCGVLINIAWIVWLVFGCIWTFSDSTCSSEASTLFQTCSVVLMAHLCVVGVPVSVIVCAVSVLPFVFFLRPDLFDEPSRGATKALIDSTTKRTTYQRPPKPHAGADEASSKGKETAGEEEEGKEKEDKVQSEEEGESCAICLSEYETGEQVRELGCGHVFHASCAEAWLQTNKTCAACRRPIDIAQP
jgi:hypothetical protein